MRFIALQILAGLHDPGLSSFWISLNLQQSKKNHEVHKQVTYNVGFKFQYKTIKNTLYFIKTVFLFYWKEIIQGFLKTDKYSIGCMHDQFIAHFAYV